MVELLRDVVRIAHTLDGVADDVQHAAALEARLSPSFSKCTGTATSDQFSAGSQALEIHVLRRIR